MTALSIPVVLAIALHCAPAEDPRMLVGIARQESGLETMTLRDDTSGQVMPVSWRSTISAAGTC